MTVYLLNEQDPRWLKPESPEPDARRQIDRFLKLFRLGSGFFSLTRMDYTPRLSELAAESHNETLRAIGAATLMGRRADWLFDGLAINLIGSVFDTYGGYFGTKKFEFFEPSGSRRPFGNQFKVPRELSYLLIQVASLVTWNELPEDSSPTKTYRMPLKMDGKKGELSLVARRLLDSTFELSEINLRISSQPSDLKRANEKFSEIVEDLRRRTALAELYRNAPEALGMPAELRAKLKAILEEEGIPNGSYSRTAFSSGPFPFERTTIKVKDSGQELVFHRCAHCADVKALTIEDPIWDDPSKDVAFEELWSWHRSICRATPAAVAAPALVRFQAPEFMTLAGPRKGRPGRVSVAERTKSSLG